MPSATFLGVQALNSAITRLGEEQSPSRLWIRGGRRLRALLLLSRVVSDVRRPPIFVVNEWQSQSVIRPSVDPALTGLSAERH